VNGTPAAWVVLALAGLGASPAQSETLRVFAAASLTGAFTEAGKAFESQHEGVRVELNFAGSQLLRTQIEQGAVADVFAAADLVHGEELQAEKLLGATVILAHNALVVVTPADGRVKGLADLARPGTQVVVAGPAVPVGRYTDQVLRNLASEGSYGDGYANRVRANVVSRESNVRAVLAKVVLGEADAGFVYRTDAVAAGAKVCIIPIPDSLNVVAVYPIGIVSEAPSPDLARAFIDFVTGPDGQAVLGNFGFSR